MQVKTQKPTNKGVKAMEERFKYREWTTEDGLEEHQIFDRKRVEYYDLDSECQCKEIVEILNKQETQIIELQEEVNKLKNRLEQSVDNFNLTIQALTKSNLLSRMKKENN